MREARVVTVDAVRLMLGLDWFALIGRYSTRAVRRLARQQQATHTVVAGVPEAAVGVVAVVSGTGDRRPLHSAAQAFAGLYPDGTVAMAAELPDHGVWWVASHEGVVIARTDVVLVSNDQAEAAMAQLAAAYPDLQVLAGDEQPDWRALATACSGATALVAVPRRLGGWPWRAAFAAVAALLLAAAWPDRLPRQTGASVATPSLPAPDLWRAATARAVQPLGVHGAGGLRDLTRALHAMPARVAGWGLADVTCIVARPQWNCVSRFVRGEPRADNAALRRSLGQGAQLAFPTLETAHWTWSVPVHVTPLEQAGLRSPQYTSEHWFSEMQAIQPAFVQAVVGEEHAVPVTEPRTQEGRAIARPAGIPVYSRRALTLSGPLRSLPLIHPLAAPVAWESLVLKVHTVSTPHLKHSALMVSLAGALYEVALD